MKALGCPHRWQVEAAHDGRLDAPALARHHEHVARCVACSHERQSLIALGQRLREQPEAIDELSLRRLRQVILERASAQMAEVQLTSSWHWRWSSLWSRRWHVGALAAGLVACSIAWLLVGARTGTIHEDDAAWVAVRGREHGSHWTRHRVGDLERIALGEGYFRVTVRRKSDDPRVIVDVPDGEIEDIGTVFEVDVGSTQTNRIVVQEGNVVFRPRGTQALFLSAGQQWTRPSARPTKDQPLAKEKTTDPSLEEAPKRTRVHHHWLGTHQPGHTRPARSDVDREPPSAGPPSAASAGPASGEDAAYLHVVALLREGRDYEARLAAFRYLEQFPHGFRRSEIEAISQPGPFHGSAR
jgi:anti-sigma factor ChrR (cupin superfamily)